MKHHITEDTVFMIAPQPTTIICVTVLGDVG